MADEAGSLVFCRISHEALRDQAKRTHFEGTDLKVFQAYQNLFEQVASDAFDAAAINEAGCVIVTKEALDRVSRAALGRRRVQGAGAKLQAPQNPFGGAPAIMQPYYGSELVAVLPQEVEKLWRRSLLPRSTERSLFSCPTYFLSCGR